MKNNVTLIGMPSAGKSTVGVLLAKRLGYSFIDVDLLIQEQEGKRLREIDPIQRIESGTQLYRWTAFVCTPACGEDCAESSIK